jgi:predicted GNAT family N-acyltransferase
MIKFIDTNDVLALRNEVLRDGTLMPDECRFATDSIEGAFHLGFYADEELATVVSLFPQNYGEYSGVGYQLRGMATSAEHRGQGMGTRLVNFAIVYLKGRKADYVWCNARKSALMFYKDCGFEIISDEFDVPGIGPHYVMYLKIQ